jgi:hypothetical protein
VALVVPYCGSYNERVVPNGYNLALARDEEGKERMGKKKELGRDSGQRTADSGMAGLGRAVRSPREE